MVIDFDDWGYEYDCREKLVELKEANPKFKVTLFTIPAKTDLEMLTWINITNSTHPLGDWIELAIHGWEHKDNYECSDWSEEDCAWVLDNPIIRTFFAKIFKAPGWQISDGCYEAIRKRGFIVADQKYNQSRRPLGLKLYEHEDFDSYHGHTWDCNCNNGIYEDWDNILTKVKEATEFQFVSEAVDGRAKGLQKVQDKDRPRNKSKKRPSK